jgi:hypothetical protein
MRKLVALLVVLASVACDSPTYPIPEAPQIATPASQSAAMATDAVQTQGSSVAVSRVITLTEYLSVLRHEIATTQDPERKRRLAAQLRDLQRFEDADHVSLYGDPQEPCDDPEQGLCDDPDRFRGWTILNHEGLYAMSYKDFQEYYEIKHHMEYTPGQFPTVRKSTSCYNTTFCGTRIEYTVGGCDGSMDGRTTHYARINDAKGWDETVHSVDSQPCPTPTA